MSEIKIIRSSLFEKYPEIIFGFSTKPGGLSPEPFCMNLSNSVGDDPENVKENRKLFFSKLGVNENNVTFQKQIHSSIINYSSKPCHFDGCVIAGIHSGWLGTKEKILTKTIYELIKKFNTDPSYLISYIGPGICQEHYEVGEEVGILFEENIRYKSGEKYYLDLKKDNFNQLLLAGLKIENIEISDLCTYKEKDLLHSYRRDGVRSGRMFGVIGMI